MPCLRCCHQSSVARISSLAIIVTFSILGESFNQDPLQDVLERLGGFASHKEGAEKEALSAAAELLGSIRARRQERKKEDAEPEIEVEQEPEAATKEDSGTAEKDTKESEEVPPQGEQQQRDSADPFADILQGFVSGTEGMKEDRDKKREEFRAADKELKDAKKEVSELERQLREAQAKVRRLEVEVKAKKEAKQEAEKAVMRAYTDIAGNVQRTAERAMGKLDESQGGQKQDSGKAKSDFSRVEPQPFAEAVLWGSRFFQGKSHKLRCCDYYDISKLAEPANVRSITLPEGVRAVLYLAKNKYLDDGSSETPSVDIFGSISEVDGLIHFRQSCCQAIQLLPGIDHSEDSSVVLYEKAEFEGSGRPFLPGDHELKQPTQVSSIRVPAGLKVTLYAAPQFKDGSFITFLTHDSRNFPREDTSIHDRDRPNLPVLSLKVRQIKEDDLHGLFIYPETDFRGRPQFFESGEHYLYPESWPDVKSAKPTPKTYARFFTTNGLLSVRGEEKSIDANRSRPHTLEVTAICEPVDYCGEHGKCVAPQRCACSGAYQGQRCHLQNPDETSAVLCERNAVVLGETLTCALHVRRFNQACNATSLFMKLRLSEETATGATLFGSPLVLERHLGGPPQELAVFPFDAVFNRTDIFTEPFVFEVFHRPQIGAFVPQIHVVERCDSAGTAALVSCKREGDDVSCSLSLRSKKGVALRCPAHAVRVLLLQDDSPIETLALLDSGEATVEQVIFKVRDVPGLGVLRFVVEIRHGPAWEAATLRLEAQAKVHVAAATRLTSAKALLRNKQFQEALQVLKECLPARSCSSLYATALIQLGRFDEAEPVLSPLGTDGAVLRQHMEAAKRAMTAANAALHADPAEAMQQLKLVIETAPLVPSLRVQLSEAALQAGDFSTALNEARQAQHLMINTAGVSGLELEDCAVLLAFGNAVLAFGNGDVARQNFHGCTRLEETVGDLTSPSALRSKMLSNATRKLQGEASVLRELLEHERWTEATEFAEKFLADHGQVWPQFASSFWGLEAAMALCVSRHALNSSDTAAVLQPCRLAVEAPLEMRDHLDDQAMLRCRVALAEMYERQQLVQEALAATEAAEAMLGDMPLDDMAAILRLLRERLLRAARGNASDETAGKPKRAAPTDMYAVLGVLKNATAAEIKRAYRQLALKYHPDKNKDPEAVQIFLDVQKAYQILSDADLRRRYDAGQENVDEEAGAKNMKPMKFRVVETDREKGIAKVWWYDPNTGEEGFMEMEIDKEEPHSSAAARTRELYEHCCLPETEL